MNNEAAIRRNIIIVLALTFLLLAGMIGAYGFGPYRGVQKKIADQEAIIEKNQAATNNAAFVKAQQSLVKAQQEQVTLATQLEFLQSRYHSLYVDLGDSPADATSPQNLKNAKLYLTFQRWQNEYYAEYGLILADELQRAIADSGVQFSGSTAGGGGAPSGAPSSFSGPPSGFRGQPGAGGGAQGAATKQVPDIVVSPVTLPKNPEDCIPLTQAATNGLLQPVAPLSFSVRGDLVNILRFFDLLTNEQSQVLKTVSSIKLDGNSPDITASFTVTPYLVLRGPSVKVTAVGGGAPAAAGASGGSGSGSSGSGSSGRPTGASS